MSNKVATVYVYTRYSEYIVRFGWYAGFYGMLCKINGFCRKAWVVCGLCCTAWKWEIYVNVYGTPVLTIVGWSSRQPLKISASNESSDLVIILV